MATRIYKTPFAASGDKEVLATADQPDGKVSLQAGWTPDYELPNDNANYRPVGRAEMNGILSEITESLGEIQQYGFSLWQSVSGGWPLNAYVSHNGRVYRSEVDHNAAEPGTTSSGWVTAFAPLYGVDVGIANTYQVPYSPVITDFLDGQSLRFRAKTANTGASTFSPNGLAAKPILGLAGAALQGGELVAGSMCEVVYLQSADCWVLVQATGGRIQVPNGTQSRHAVTLSQVQALIPSVPNASTSVAGISRFSTASEAQSWSEAATVLTPSSLAQSFGAANQSLAPNGYQRLPGGLIIQWALGPGANPAQDSTISYPIPFPTRTLQAVASMTTDCDCIAQVTSFTQNTVTVRLDQIGSSGTGSAPRVIAIGH